MPQMSKVELYAAIRRDHRGGMSMRQLERKHGVTWRTVRKALDSAWPEPRKRLPPRATALDPYKPVIDEILRADLDAPRKQRHTVTRTRRSPIPGSARPSSTVSPSRAPSSRPAPTTTASPAPSTSRGARQGRLTAAYVPRRPTVLADGWPSRVRGVLGRGLKNRARRRRPRSRRVDPYSRAR
jgi:lambda repressor-like predicted transcriptional regulator